MRRESGGFRIPAYCGIVVATCVDFTVNEVAAFASVGTSAATGAFGSAGMPYTPGVSATEESGRLCRGGHGVTTFLTTSVYNAPTSWTRTDRK